MPNKMEEFTQRARMTLSKAQQIAEQFEQTLITPAHILIALPQIEGGVARAVLTSLDLSDEKLRAIFSKLSHDTTIQPDSIELAYETKKVLEMAVDEARRMGHHYIGTEHLLLGLMRVDSVAIDVLREFDINPEQVKRQTRLTVNTNPHDPLE
ncbi:MAG: Clp protease N-terminal domain-containing protein [Aggregatilineales bacterium]